MSLNFKTRKLMGFVYSLSAFFSPSRSGAQTEVYPLCLSKFRRLPGPLKHNPLSSKLLLGGRFYTSFSLGNIKELGQPETYKLKTFLKTQWMSEGIVAFDLPSQWLPCPFKLKAQNFRCVSQKNLRGKGFNFQGLLPATVGLEAAYDQLLLEFQLPAHPKQWMFAPASTRALWKFNLGGLNQFLKISSSAEKHRLILIEGLQGDKKRITEQGDAYSFYGTLYYGLFLNFLGAQVRLETGLSTISQALESWNWFNLKGRKINFDLKFKVLTGAARQLQSFLDNETFIGIQPVQRCLYNSSIDYQPPVPKEENELVEEKLPSEPLKAQEPESLAEKAFAAQERAPQQPSEVTFDIEEGKQGPETILVDIEEEEEEKQALAEARGFKKAENSASEGILARLSTENSVHDLSLAQAGSNTRLEIQGEAHKVQKSGMLIRQAVAETMEHLAAQKSSYVRGEQDHFKKEVGPMLFECENKELTLSGEIEGKSVNAVEIHSRFSAKENREVGPANELSTETKISSLQLIDKEQDTSTSIMAIQSVLSCPFDSVNVGYEAIGEVKLDNKNQVAVFAFKGAAYWGATRVMAVKPSKTSPAIATVASLNSQAEAHVFRNV